MNHPAKNMKDARKASKASIQRVEAAIGKAGELKKDLEEIKKIMSEKVPPCMLQKQTDMALVFNQFSKWVEDAGGNVDNERAFYEKWNATSNAGSLILTREIRAYLMQEQGRFEEILRN